MARFWVLRVADRSAGNLKCNYSGLKSVQSDQVITFKDASGLPTPEEEDVFCDVIASFLNDTVSMKNYIVTDVNCLSYEFIPYESYRKRLRLFQLGWGAWRRLQEGVGDLNVYYNISSEYAVPVGQTDTMGDGFGDLIEDSINRGTVGDDILKSLQDRQIEAVQYANVVASEVETPSPTSSPTYEQVKPNSLPSASEEVGTEEMTEPTLNSRKTSVILVAMLSLVVLCSTFSMYFHYLRHLRVLAKDDYSTDNSEIARNALMTDGNNDRFNDNRLDWGPSSSMRSLTVSALGDEPDLIPHSYDERVRRTSLGVSKDDDANTTSSTISDVNSRNGTEDKFIGSESMNRLRAFERRADLQKITQSDDFKEHFSEPISSKQMNLNDNLDSFDERTKKKLRPRDGDLAPVDTKKTSSAYQNMSSDSSFEDRLKSKLSMDDSRENKMQGNDHKSTNSEGSFDARLRSKLFQDDALSVSGNSQRLYRGRNDPQYLFESRLRVKFTKDESKSPSGDRHKITTSLQSMNDEMLRKLDASPDIPSDISFAPHRKSDSRDSSLDSFDKGIHKKLSSDDFHISSVAMNQSMTSINSFEERLRRKFEASPAIPSDLTYSKYDETSPKISSVGGKDLLDDSFAKRIRRKLSKENVGQLPTSRHQKLTSMDSTNAQIQRKQSNHDDSSIRPRDSFAFKKSVSRNTFEERIQQKLAQESAEALFVDSPNGITSSDPMDIHIQRKLRELHQGIPSDTSITKNAESSVDSRDSFTFEERIQQKLARKLARASSINSDPLIIQANIADERLERKLKSNNDDRSDASAKHSKNSSRENSVDLFDTRINQKIPQHVIQALSADFPQKTSDTIEQIVQQRHFRSDTKPPSDGRVQGMTYTEAMDSRESNMNIRQKYSDNLDSDTYELRLLRKLHESSSNLSQHTTEERIESKLSTDAARFEGSPSRETQLFTFDEKMQKNMSTHESAQSRVANSFEAKLRQKLTSHNAQLGSSANIDDSFKIRLERKLAQSRQEGEKYVLESPVDGSPASTESIFDDLDQKFKRKLASSSSSGKHNSRQHERSQKTPPESD
eukprot:CCRYP_017068-RC/>CCRYP_017068-RC protein AED:0.01 eAED:0.01 QI:2073/1/1/1/1/0.8/5/675/1069